MLRKMKAGETNQSIPLFIQDTSSIVGAGLGSLVFNSSGLAAKYRRQGDSSWTTISLATMTLGTWATGGFISDGGSVTGGYEFGIPNAVIASSAGVEWAEIEIYGAANMLAVLIFIELDAVNYQSATAFMTGVNSLAPPSNWNLMVVDASGRVDVSKVLGAAQTARDLGGTLGVAGAGLTALGDTRIANLDTTVSSRLAPTVAARTLDVAATGEAGLDFDNVHDASGAHTLTNITVPAVTLTATATNLTNAPTNGDFTAAMKTALNAATPASVSGNVGGIAGVTLPTVVPSLAQIQAGLPTDTSIAADVLDATASGHNTSGTIGAKINSAAAGSSDPLLNNVPGSYASGTAGYALGHGVPLDLTQAVPTSNTAQSVGDALNAARAQGFGKWVLSGTTLTLYAANGTTVVRTFTLDDATSPLQRS